jgi:hypothetical protein
VTVAYEVEILEDDNTMRTIAEWDWVAIMLDACGMQILGQVADETSTWDVYEVRHQDCTTRTYAVEVDRR